MRKASKHRAHQDRLVLPSFLRPQGAGPRAPDPGSHGNGSLPQPAWTVLGPPAQLPGRAAAGTPGGEENLSPGLGGGGAQALLLTVTAPKGMLEGTPRADPIPETFSRPPGRWAPERSFPVPPAPLPGRGRRSPAGGSRRLRRTLRCSTSEVAAETAPVLEPRRRWRGPGPPGAARAGRRLGRLGSARSQPRSAPLGSSPRSSSNTRPRLFTRPSSPPTLPRTPPRRPSYGRRGRAEAVGSGPEPRSRAERRRCHGRQAHTEGPRTRRALPVEANAP